MQRASSEIVSSRDLVPIPTSKGFLHAIFKRLFEHQCQIAEASHERRGKLCWQPAPIQE